MVKENKETLNLWASTEAADDSLRVRGQTKGPRESTGGGTGGTADGARGSEASTAAECRARRGY